MSASSHEEIGVSSTDDEPLPYEADYVPNFDFDTTESYVQFCIDGL